MSWWIKVFSLYHRLRLLVYSGDYNARSLLPSRQIKASSWGTSVASHRWSPMKDRNCWKGSSMKQELSHGAEVVKKISVLNQTDAGSLDENLMTKQLQELLLLLFNKCQLWCNILQWESHRSLGNTASHCQVNNLSWLPFMLQHLIRWQLDWIWWQLWARDSVCLQ